MCILCPKKKAVRPKCRPWKSWRLPVFKVYTSITVPHNSLRYYPSFWCVNLARKFDNDKSAPHFTSFQIEAKCTIRQPVLFIFNFLSSSNLKLPGLWPLICQRLHQQLGADKEFLISLKLSPRWFDDTNYIYVVCLVMHNLLTPQVCVHLSN